MNEFDDNVLMYTYYILCLFLHILKIYPEGKSIQILHLPPFFQKILLTLYNLYDAVKFLKYSKNYLKVEYTGVKTWENSC